jgi:hypothetical protein
MLKALRLVHFLGEGGEKRRVPIIHRPRQLRMLARSKDAGIRFAVARSRYVPLEVLHMLMADPSWVVRMAVAWHEKTTVPMLWILAEDPEKAVSEAATRRLRLAEELLAEDGTGGSKESELVLCR